ncbi:hypothetical protein [Sphingomonas nostoxanthinifaciens]|uniref:hypothetical protein n=1 Tax=Sphingomonas nostoxanthinifaciens TaxID=2872652 RepID=UPI001CC1C389|nr:hypothetical protein [Sphingomonas nostoxanthinifaciens]UAK25506.1 hypothetical protein K8P63_04900 [Sphingomonas nostoxanthinifaciens]
MRSTSHAARRYSYGQSPLIVPPPFFDEAYKAAGAWDDINAKISPAAGNALLNALEVESPFNMARVAYFNPDATTAATIESWDIGVASTILAAQPIPALMVPLTVGVVSASAGAPFTLPAAQAAATGQVSANRIPTWLFSDWVALRSIARSDGGTRPVAVVRSRSSGLLPFTTTTGSWTTGYAGAGGWLSISGGREYRTWWGSGASAPTGYANGSTANTPVTQNQCILLQTRTTAQTLTIVETGDSKNRGYTTNTGFDSMARNAQRLNPYAFKTGVANCGNAGAITSTIQVVAKKMIDFFAGPNVAVIIPAYSQNDNSNTAAADLTAEFARCLDICAYAVSKGCIPIIDCGTPWASPDASSDVALANLRNNIVPVSGYRFFKAFDALGDGANTQRLQVQYQGDGNHPNDAGQAIKAQIVLPILRDIALSLGMTA